MKINKENPRHWVYASAFAFSLLIALAIRPFIRRGGVPLILLYGHKLNGNLRSLYEELIEDTSFEVAYLTIDPVYHNHLVDEGVASILAFRRDGVRALARVVCIITDHGPQLMSFLQIVSNIKFIDVWHGIPFKGWARDEFTSLRRYNEIWAPSELVRAIYVQRFGFEPSRVRTTGYGRTDRLIRRSDDMGAIKRSLRIEEDQAVVLFAPTWGHGTDRQVIPFDMEIDDFFGALRSVLQPRSAVCLIRTHLNTDFEVHDPGAAMLFVPHERFPDTEALLLISDVLLCDWSSIAFDYLLLDRPTVFLDVPAPFSMGFTLDPTYRYGALAHDIEGLERLLADYLDSPESYHAEHGPNARSIKRTVYGDMADGKAAKRYVEALRAILSSV